MNNKQENAVKTFRFHFRKLVRVVELLDQEELLLSSSNYSLFSKFKAFGVFSESLFTLWNNSKMLCGSNMVLKNLFISKIYPKYLLIVLYWNIKWVHQTVYPYVVFVTVNFFGFQFFVQFVPTRYKRCNLRTFYVNGCH